MKKFFKIASVILAFAVLASCFAMVASATNYNIGTVQDAVNYDSGKRYFDANPANKIQVVCWLECPAQSPQSAIATFNVWLCTTFGATKMPSGDRSFGMYQTVGPTWTLCHANYYSFSASMSNNYLPSGIRAPVALFYTTFKNVS